MTVYVQRDESGRVTGVYARPQPGYAEEAVDDGAAEVVAFRAPPTGEAVLAAATTAAVAQLLTGTDPAAVAVRVIARRLCTWLNDEREARGQPRRTEEEIVAQLLSDAAAGWGAPLGPPG